MPKQLTAQTATITTAAVEVKTLTVSGKQVTLAVFRQLREEPLIAEDGTLNGVPWGYVNYHPDKCEGSQLAHWHIVWQQGDGLLRSRVAKRASFDDWRSDDSEAFYSEEASAYMGAWVREWLHGRTKNNPLAESPSGKRGHHFNGFRDLKIAGLTVTAGLFSSLTCAIVAANAMFEATENQKVADQYPNDGYYIRRAEESGESARVALAALDAEVNSWDMPFEALAAEHEAAVALEVERRQRHRDVRKALADLPQLFIAV